MPPSGCRTPRLNLPPPRTSLPLAPKVMFHRQKPHLDAETYDDWKRWGKVRARVQRASHSMQRECNVGTGLCRSRRHLAPRAVTAQPLPPPSYARPHASPAPSPAAADCQAAVLPLALPMEAVKHKSWDVQTFLNRHRRDPFVSSVVLEVESAQARGREEARSGRGVGKGRCLCMSGGLVTHGRGILSYRLRCAQCTATYTCFPLLNLCTFCRRRRRCTRHWRQP